MKKINRLAHVPVRSPYQDWVATQRRMVVLERVGKFAVALVVLLVVVGHFGA
jgi:hypothetical protein